MIRTLRHKHWLRAFASIALAVGFCASVAFAHEPLLFAPPNLATNSKDDLPEPKRNKIAFSFTDAPSWETVIEWFAKETKTTFIGAVKPPKGTFTFLSPTSTEKLYTIPQIVDIINDALTTKGYIMTRHEGTFTLLPLDEEVDPSLIPSVPVDRLDEHGKKEIVRIRIVLKNLRAADAAAEIKPMLCKFAVIAAEEKGNTLVMTDLTTNLRDVVEFLWNLDSSHGHNDWFAFRLRSIQSRGVEEARKKSLLLTAVMDDAKKRKLSLRAFGIVGPLPSDPLWTTYVIVFLEEADKVRVNLFVTPRARTTNTATGMLTAAQYKKWLESTLQTGVLDNRLRKKGGHDGSKGSAKAFASNFLLATWSEDGKEQEMFYGDAFYDRKMEKFLDLFSSLGKELKQTYPEKPSCK